MLTDGGPRAPAIEEVPPAPRRPSPHARRLIFAYGGGQWIVRLVGWGFLLIGLPLSIPFVWGWPVDIAIALGGTRATGTVLSARWNWNASIGGRHPASVRYEYAAAGATWEGAYDALIAPPPEGAAITIEHSSALPGWSRIAGTRRAWTPWPVPLFVMAFPVLGVGLLVGVARRNRREIRAFTLGRPALATITFHGQDESTELNGRHPAMIRWEFRVPSGEVFEGSLTSMSVLELEPFASAGKVVVLYDPDEPACNTLYVQ